MWSFNTFMVFLPLFSRFLRFFEQKSAKAPGRMLSIDIRTGKFAFLSNNA